MFRRLFYSSGYRLRGISTSMLLCPRNSPGWATSTMARVKGENGPPYATTVLNSSQKRNLSVSRSRLEQSGGATPSGPVGAPELCDEVHEMRLVELTGTEHGTWQSDRFPNPSEAFSVYETPQRKELWEFLDTNLKTSHTGGKSNGVRVAVTGISGCGKSHALAWWTREQQRKGHLVLYIPTGQLFANPAWPEIVVDYLFHAAKSLWVKHGLRKEDKGAGADEVLQSTEFSHRWTRLKGEAWALISNDFPSLADVNFFLRSKAWSNPEPLVIFLNFLSEGIIKEVNSPNPSLQIRSICVIDQDNRLHRPLFRETDLAQKAIQVTSTAQFDLGVFCASANNEGWEWRGLQSRTFTLEPEAVPFKFLNFVAPSLKFSSVDNPYPVLGISQQQFRRLDAYPLELRLFAKTYERIRLFELAFAAYEEERTCKVMGHLRAFVKENPRVRRLRLHMALMGERSYLDVDDDRRYVYCRNDGTLAFVSRIAEYSAHQILKESLGLEPNRPDPEVKGYWYEAKVLQLCSERNVLQFHFGKEPDRTVQRWNGNVEDLLSKTDISPKHLYLVPATHRSQRAFDFALVTQAVKETHGLRGTYVFFVRVCSGSHHKDSFRDLVRHGDVHRLQHLNPQRHRLGYIWITPDRAGVLTLKTNEGVKSFSFKEPKPECLSNAMNAEGPISYRHLIGRTAGQVALPYPEKSPFKTFLGGFNEMMIVIPMPS